MLLLAAIGLMAQTPDEQPVQLPATQTQDTVVFVEGDDSSIRVLPAEAWRPNPMKAVWLGTILPGAGQIYNRSYWKLPIVYGAFMGCAYAITWTNGMYQDYKTAYRDIYYDKNYDPDDPTKSYVAILPDGYTIARYGGKSNYMTTLQNAQNGYRRYRDISIVATVVVYLLSIIDAYVDAQLFDFDISTDLTLNVAPQVSPDQFRSNSTEIKLAIHLK